MTLKILFVLFIACQAHATWPSIIKKWLVPREPSVITPTFDPKPLLLEHGIISAQQYVLDKKQYDLLNDLVKKRCSTLTKMLIELNGKVGMPEAELKQIRELNQDVQKYVEESQKLGEILTEQHRIHGELVSLLLEKRLLSKLQYYTGPKLEDVPEIKTFLRETLADSGPTTGVIK